MLEEEYSATEAGWPPEEKEFSEGGEEACIVRPETFDEEAEWTAESSAERKQAAASLALPGPNADIATLKKFLAERFPGATSHEADVLPCGASSIDETLGGGVPLQAVTEVVCTGPSCGGQVMLLGLLAALGQRRRFGALVDGKDSFDPCTASPDVLNQLLWVRCQKAKQALQAADILLRDENFPLVLLDLRWNDAREFRRIPATTWYRLQRLSMHSGTGLVVFSKRLLAPSARVRIELSRPLTLDGLETPLADLLGQLQATVSKGLREERLHAAG